MDTHRVEPSREQLEQRPIGEILESLDQGPADAMPLSVGCAQCVALRVDGIGGKRPLEKGHLSVAFAEPRPSAARASLRVVPTNCRGESRGEGRGRPGQTTALDQILRDLKQAAWLAAPAPKGGFDGVREVSADWLTSLRRSIGGRLRCLTAAASGGWATLGTAVRPAFRAIVRATLGTAVRARFSIALPSTSRAATPGALGFRGLVIEVRENQLVVIVFFRKNISTWEVLRGNARLVLRCFGGCFGLFTLGLVGGLGRERSLAIGRGALSRLFTNLFDLFGRVADREYARLHLDDGGVATVLLDHGGEPRAHRGFRGLPDV